VTAVAAARLLQGALEPPFALEGFLVPMAACVGIGLAPDHATTRSEILRCADVAASQAKARQTGVEVYRR
jgi:predicted signal transduction protein with EAL and GGDEF domain